MHIVATAGHVDHGKSTLIKALTGIEPDRFIEEQTRGLTIDLGFAHTVLPSGRTVDFVDVPGHARFIHNMLAGVGVVDACLFVVDVNEGWKPQSEEHLRILELLGISSGLVALTKIATADDEVQEIARMDVMDHLAGTFLEEAAIIGVDSPTAVGLDSLRAALDDVLATTPVSPDLERPRLWIDRRFAMKGAGTVVTGTLTGGRMAVGEELVLIGSGRLGQEVRVRGAQTHGEGQSSVGPGHRVALNLVGIAPRVIARGAALVRRQQWHLTSVIDVSLQVLEGLDHEVERRGAYKLYVGSGEHAVRLQIIGQEKIKPGEQGLARLWLPVSLPLVPGDRFILRESGRSETVGGGEILDVDPRLPLKRARPSRSVERVVAERGWVEADELSRLTGVVVKPSFGDRWVVDPPALEAFRRDLVEQVTEAGPLGLDLATVDERGRVVLGGHEDVVIRSGRAFSMESQQGVAGAMADHPWLEALRTRPWTPPDPSEFDVPPVFVSQLVRQGLVVLRDGVYFAPEAIDHAARIVAGLLSAQPEGVTVSEVRDALETTRKFVLPLLAELDATGVTRRRGDVRVGGPRLPDG